MYYNFKLILYIYIYKGKAVPLQTWCGPEGSRNVRFPDFMTTEQDGGKVVSLTLKCSWYSFPLEVESPEGHSAIGRILCQ